MDAIVSCKSIASNWLRRNCVIWSSVLFYSQTLAQRTLHLLTIHASAFHITIVFEKEQYSNLVFTNIFIFTVTVFDGYITRLLVTAI